MSVLFHLALHVDDLAAARQFYCGVLGCRAGRSTASWLDIDFFGHQLSLHLGEPLTSQHTGLVAGQLVPMPHFGVLLPMADWQALADRLTAQPLDFVLPPSRRFVGQPGEQASMFLLDPAKNPIEIKGFQQFDGVFAQ